MTFAVFSLCGLLAGVAGILWGMQFGTINATAATGVTLQVIAAVVVGGVNIFGGSGTVVGAGLGALFLAFISNALILLRCPSSGSRRSTASSSSRGQARRGAPPPGPALERPDARPP